MRAAGGDWQALHHILPLWFLDILPCPATAMPRLGPFLPRHQSLVVAEIVRMMRVYDNIYGFW
jgi:hypothetical protein